MLALYHDEDTKKNTWHRQQHVLGNVWNPVGSGSKLTESMGFLMFFDLISVDFRHVSVMLRQNPPQLGNSGWTFGGNTTVCQIAVRHFSAFQPEVGQVADQEAKWFNSTCGYLFWSYPNLHKKPPEWCLTWAQPSKYPHYVSLKSIKFHWIPRLHRLFVYGWCPCHQRFGSKNQENYLEN